MTRRVAVLIVLVAAPLSAEIVGVPPWDPNLDAVIHPRFLAADGDGAVWFSEEATYPHSVGFFDAGGHVTSFPVPCGECATGDEIVYVFGLAPAPDGSVWFDYFHAHGDGSPIDSWIGRFTRTGTFSSWPLPTADGFRWYGNSYGHSDITKGADGNFWFTENGAGKVGKITEAGQITEYPLSGLAATPSVIAAGPDGNLWFTEFLAHRIARITPDGVLTEFPLSSAVYPLGITAGSDGALWFTEQGTNQLGRITTAGTVTETPFGAGHVSPTHIASGPGDTLWVTFYSNEIALVQLSPASGAAAAGGGPPGSAPSDQDSEREQAAPGPISTQFSPIDDYALRGACASGSPGSCTGPTFDVTTECTQDLGCAVLYSFSGAGGDALAAALAVQPPPPCESISCGIDFGATGENRGEFYFHVDVSSQPDGCSCQPRDFSYNFHDGRGPEPARSSFENHTFPKRGGRFDVDAFVACGRLECQASTVVEFFPALVRVLHGVHHDHAP